MQEYQKDTENGMKFSTKTMLESCKIAIDL
jgi:hypothetical protein